MGLNSLAPFIISSRLTENTDERAKRDTTITKNAFFIYTPVTNYYQKKDTLISNQRQRNKTKEKWFDMSPEDISIIESFSRSYSNTTQSIELHFNVEKEDTLDVYAYNCANDIESPLIIRNIPCSYQEFDEYQRLYAEALEQGNIEDANMYKEIIDGVLNERSSFQTPEGYIHGKNELSVWVNGIRQYNVIEKSNGMGFDLPEKVRGIVTYVIERTEKGNENTGEREILDKNNVVPNTINVYRTKKSLYPGRVVVYINGLRRFNLSRNKK